MTRISSRGPRPFTLVVMIALAAFLTLASAQQVTIHVLYPGGDQPQAQQTVKTLVAGFEQTHPDIKVVFQSVGWDSAYQKIATDLLAGNAPDVIYIGGRWIAPFSQLGGLLPLDSYVDQAKRASFPSGVLKGNEFKGKLMGLPVAFSTKALYYRTDLIPQPPKTWAELLADAKKITQEHPGMYGIGISGAAHVSTTSQFFNFLYQAGGSVFDDKGNVSLDTPAGVKALTFYTDLYRTDHVAPNPVEYNREQLPVLFKQGKIAMMITGPWGKGIMGLDPNNPSAPYATATLPCDVRCGGIQVGDSIVIAKNTPHPKEAYAFVDYWTSLKAHTTFDLNGGLVPMVQGEQSNAAFQGAFWKPFLEMISQGFPQPQPLAWEPFQTIISDMIQNVLLGKQTPEQALQAATKAIQDKKLEPAAASGQ